MSNAIKPTVGRVVWYWPMTSDQIVGGGDQPLAAIVAHVWTDSCINLAVFDANGVAHNRTSVLLVQEGEPKPGAGFAEWMPYQKQVASGAIAPTLHATPVSDSDVEAEIKAKGLTAPRITPADIEANILIAYYFTGEDALQYAGQNGSPFVPHAAMKLLTFCVLVLRNGFTVTGESACASPENFDAELGRKIARQHAVAKVWGLMGYALKERLAAVPADFRDRVRLEKQELDEKIRKLTAFVAGETFASLPAMEQKRMRAQLTAMEEYSGALYARIDAFTESQA